MNIFYTANTLVPKTLLIVQSLEFEKFHLWDQSV